MKKKSASAWWAKANRCPKTREPASGPPARTFSSASPRDLADSSLFHSVSLVAFLAWVGLGADGLSSSCYGPPESFAQLGEHASYLAIFLGLAIAATVFVIAACYSHIIEEFPSGGGGYLVASKLLGNRVGVVSGLRLAGRLRADDYGFHLCRRRCDLQPLAVNIFKLGSCRANTLRSSR